MNSGSLKKKATVAQILALACIIEVKKNHLSAVLTFMDFRKVFDSIHHSKMKVLKAYSIPPNLFRAIDSTCTNTQSKASNT